MALGAPTMVSTAPVKRAEGAVSGTTTGGFGNADVASGLRGPGMRDMSIVSANKFRGTPPMRTTQSAQNSVGAAISPWMHGGQSSVNGVTGRTTGSFAAAREMGPTAQEAQDHAAYQNYQRQQQAMSDWLGGAIGMAGANYGAQSNAIGAQGLYNESYYGDLGGLLGDQYRNSLGLLDASQYRDVTLPGWSNQLTRDRAQADWGNLQDYIGDQRGTNSMDHLLAQLGFDNQGQSAQRTWDLLGQLTATQGQGINQTWEQQQEDFNYGIGASSRDRDLGYMELGQGRDQATQRHAIEQWLNQQNRGYNTETRDLADSRSALAHGEQQRATSSDAIGRGARLARGTTLDMDATDTRLDHARADSDLSYRTRDTALSGQQQMSDLELQRAIDAFGVGRNRVRNQFLDTRQGLESGNEMNRIGWEQSRANLSHRYQTGQNTYDTTMRDIELGRMGATNANQASNNALDYSYGSGLADFNYGMGQADVQDRYLGSLGNTFDLNRQGLGIDYRRGQLNNSNAAYQAAQSLAAQQNQLGMQYGSQVGQYAGMMYGLPAPSSGGFGNHQYTGGGGGGGSAGRARYI